MAAPLLTEDSLFRFEKVVSIKPHVVVATNRSVTIDYFNLNLCAKRYSHLPSTVNQIPLWESSQFRKAHTLNRSNLLRINYTAKADGAGAVTSGRHQ